MAANDLNKPLGLGSERKPRGARVYLAIAGAAGLVAVATVAWLAISATGGPTATAVINAPTTAGPIAPERTGSTAPIQGLTEVEPTGGLSDVGEVVIHDPSEQQPIELASLPQKDLIEASDDGPLPRISKTGTRPLDAYARPAEDAGEDIRIAIVVGGLGLDTDSTRQAINALPGPVTLAFAPYGDDLGASVAAARIAGHELLLQIPLEPFNYPKTDPGLNTLTADASAEENRGRLHWLLSRMTNYVGVMNYMGARFTGEAGAMAPVMKELGDRGLLYLDDGSSGRSKAAELAGGVTPFLRSDLVLDADLSAAAIDDRLRQLQAIARERGYAVATATAFPLTVERVAAFAKAAADKGIAIVPLTAILPGRP
jgi:polysaccharide deacetylase 2 family uncharacterized protein YibQ